MTTLQKTNLSEQALQSLAADLAHAIAKGAIIYLDGQLGAGKTTFTRGFLRGLGYVDKVKSPTYTLVEPYEVGGKTIYHFDLYRLQEPEELEHIGIRDYVTEDALCLFEWPEKGLPLLPSPDLTCKISMSATEMNRDLTIEAHTPLGQAILEKLH